MQTTSYIALEDVFLDPITAPPGYPNKIYALSMTIAVRAKNSNQLLIGTQRYLDIVEVKPLNDTENED